MKDKDLIELAHKYKMEEIAVQIEGEKQLARLKHELELETQRIKNASIQRNLGLRRDR